MFKDTQRAFHAHEVMFFDMNKYTKINVIKNALLFLPRAPTHHSFTFNLQFLHELKHKVNFSKTVCGIFNFRYHLVFNKVYIFVQEKARTL